MTGTSTVPLVFLVALLVVAHGDRARAIPLYGSDTNQDQLVRIDSTSAASTQLGSIPDNTEGLAYDPVLDVLYGSWDKFAGEPGRLYQISRSDGTATLLGDIGTTTNLFDNVEGLAYDSINGILYGSDSAAGGFTGCIVAFTPSNPGGATCLGAVGFSDVRGLAYDPSTQTLYGVDRATDVLLTISTLDGSGTSVGAVGFGDVRGLAFQGGTLFGIDTTSGALISINTATGSGTLIGSTGSPELNGLAAVPEPSTSLLLCAGLGVLAWRGRQSSRGRAAP